MRKYLDYATYWDLLFCFVLCTCLVLCKPTIVKYFPLPTTESLEALGVSLVTVSATLIGFLLTIITVIITFKKGFEIQKEEQKSSKEDTSDVVLTIFDKNVSKQDKFYDSNLHQRVVKVFIGATFEIGIVLFLLLYLQFCGSGITILWNSLIHLVLLLLVTFSVIRSLYIFRLFLNVHIK